MPGFDNDVVYAKNVDFSGGTPVAGKMLLDGQLLIGRTALNAGGTHIDVSTLTAGNNVTITNGAGAITIATADLHVAKWIVNATPNAGGNQTTIQAAINAAVSGETVFIFPGTYTENLTLKAGVNLTAFSDGYSPNVTIVGTCNFSAAGSVTISGVRLQTNAAPFLTVTGSAASIVYLQNCYLNITNAHGIDSTTTSTSSQIWIVNCLGNLANTFHVFDIDHGFIEIISTLILNLSSTSVNTVDNDAGAFFKNTYFSGPITTSGTSSFTASNTTLDNSQNGTITIGGTGNNFIHTSSVEGGTSSAISIGTGATLRLNNSFVGSSNTNAIVGLGTISYSGVSFGSGGSGSALISTSNRVNAISWTPALDFAGGTTGITYSSRAGTYSVIGDIIVFTMSMVLSNKGSSVGTANITGLPIVTPTTWIFPLSASSLTFTGAVNARIASGSATINLDSFASAGARAVLSDTAFSNSTIIQISGSYLRT